MDDAAELEKALAKPATKEHEVTKHVDALEAIHRSLWRDKQALNLARRSAAKQEGFLDQFRGMPMNPGDVLP